MLDIWNHSLCKRLLYAVSQQAGSTWWETHWTELKLNNNFRMACCPSPHNGRGKFVSEEEKSGVWGLGKEIKKTFLKKDGPGWSHYTFCDTLTVQLWTLARLPVTWSHGNVTAPSSEAVETWMFPACKGKGSNRRSCQKKDQQQTINTVQVLLMLILSTWGLVIILDICKAILKCFCPLNPLILSIYLEFCLQKELLWCLFFTGQK